MVLIWSRRTGGGCVCMVRSLPTPALMSSAGARVLAPCAEQVVNAVDGLPDMQISNADPVHIAGNHVLLRCANADVLLSRLRPGSVQVCTGAPVRVGDWLGSVGNSGNTREPHHVHAQGPAPAEASLGDGPRPIQFNARFPVRGDRIDSP